MPKFFETIYDTFAGQQIARSENELVARQLFASDAAFFVFVYNDFFSFSHFHVLSLSRIVHIADDKNDAFSGVRLLKDSVDPRRKQRYVDVGLTVEDYHKRLFVLKIGSWLFHNLGEGVLYFAVYFVVSKW